MNSVTFQILSSFFFSLLGMEIKYFSNQINIESIVFYRCLLGFIIVTLIILIKEKGMKSLKTKNFKIHILRASFGTSAMLFGYSALLYIPLAQATAIGFTKTFFVILLATLFLKEKFQKSNLILAIFGFIGVYYSISPDDINHIYGSFLCLAAALCVACGIISISYLSKKEETLTILFYHSFISTIITLIIFRSSLDYLSLSNYFGVIIICITALSGQYFNIKSYRDGKTSKIIIIGYTRILFSFLLGYFIFSEKLDFSQLFGLLIIILTTLSTLKVKKRIRDKDKDSLG